MNVKNLLILSLSSLLLSGCAIFGPSVDTVEVVAKPVEKVPLNLEQPQPLKPKQIDWFVITPENQEEVFAKLKEKKFSVVLYGLTDDDYKDLSENLAKLRSFILQQKAIIESYKEYYEPPVPQETLK